MDLAAELIFHVLELSVSAYDVRRYCNPEREYAHLCNTALVCKAWVAPSQILLWRYVDLAEPSHVQRWIDSPAAGQYTTLGLYIRGDGLGDLVLQHVLSRTVGLETLHLAFFTPSSAECLALPGLKDLTALVVYNSFISNEGACDFAFRLRFFQTMYSNIHPAVINDMFRKSANTLECLELEQHYKRDSLTLIGLYKSFSIVATNIRALRVTDAYRSLVPFFASCAALKQLELTYDVDVELATAIFKVLPTPLEDLYLKVDHPGDFFTGFVLDVVSQRDYLSLKHLKRLHLKQDLINEMGEEFQAKLKAHNITVLAVPENYW